MTTADLLQRMQQKLGEQTVLYTDEELVLNGLNPALRLLTLRYPQLLRRRATITVTTDLPFYDLRLVSPRIHRIRRVVLGTITGDDPVRTANTGEFKDLTMTTVTKLQFTHDWLAKKGTIEHYWRWGTNWFGLYRRPTNDAVVTLLFDAVPDPLSVDTPTGEPAVISAYHPLLADIATGLVLVKEGATEGERGVTLIQESLGLAQGVPA